MATYITKDYQSIDFSVLKQTNVFETFDFLLIYGFQLNTQIDRNVTQTGIIATGVVGKDWTQTYTGNTRSATHTITSTDNLYSVAYTGSGINSAGDGVYQSITYTLPNLDGNAIRMTIEGSLTRFSSGDVGSGNITKIVYELGSLKVELFGSMTKNYVIVDGGTDYNTFTGSITGFNFIDADGQLSITNISPALDLATFDNLTFDQLASDATAQLTQTTNSDLQDLFDELAKDIYKSGTDTVVVDPDTSGSSGGVGSSTNPYVIPSNIENLNPLAEGTSDYYATGNALNNVMTGNSVRNFFQGLGGNDTLNGLGGDDTLEGGEGLDTLNGGEGNDTLDGGANKDTLAGGNGDDRYVLDVASNGKYEDKIVEAKTGGSDTLAYRNESLTAQTKAVTLKLVKYFENLDVSLTGTMNFNLTGDAANNVLTGNAGNNVIDGGKGADTMAGGAGDDTYVIDNAGDVVTEASNAGTDLVNIKLTTGSYTLGSNVENGLLSSAKTYTLTGNALDNTLTNKKGTVTLDGADGNDVLNGGSGRDTLVGGAGVDALFGGAGNDVLIGGADADTLDGGKGNDTMIGGAGNDTMIGGAGADTFTWSLADAGTVGSAAVDIIADFSVKQKDVLDLRDLLPSNAVESDVAGLLANFIDVRIEGANTVIGINTDGNLSGGENLQINLANIDLFALTKTTDETGLLNQLITKNQLLID